MNLDLWGGVLMNIALDSSTSETSPYSSILPFWLIMSFKNLPQEGISLMASIKGTVMVMSFKWSSYLPNCLSRLHLMNLCRKGKVLRSTLGSSFLLGCYWILYFSTPHLSFLSSFTLSSTFASATPLSSSSFTIFFLLDEAPPTFLPLLKFMAWRDFLGWNSGWLGSLPKGWGVEEACWTIWFSRIRLCETSWSILALYCLNWSSCCLLVVDC